VSLDLHMPLAKRPSPPKRTKPAAPKRGAPIVDALAHAAWAQADAALAEALIECDRALNAGSAKLREEALSLLSLALTRAARRRGLTRVGKPGATEAFDAAKHDLARAGRAPARVRVVEAGVARGGEVLIKARVKAVRAKRK
jgi:hypothetical protein